MTETPAKKSRFSRFDVTVAIITVVLLAVVGAAAFFSSPQRRSPTVAYLYPAYNDANTPLIQNIWMAPIDDPDAAVQLTDSERGVFDFGVSPDGRYIAFSEADPATNAYEIKLLDLQTRSITQLTNCGAEDADCRTPVFRQGSDVIAYERQTINRQIDTVGPGALRIWLLDITTQPYQTRPLSDDPQFVGYSPQWSLNGDAIAFYSSNIANPGVMVYNFAPAEGEKTLKFIPSSHGTVGTLSPNGKQLIFPEVVLRTEESASGEPRQSLNTYLRIADLSDLVFEPLTDSEAPTDDAAAKWHPDGQHVAIERRYTDDRYTRGYQLYLLDLDTNALEPLIVDERYSHGFFDWNQNGDKLVLQRFRVLNDDGTSTTDSKPGVWVQNMESDTLVHVAENAFHPRWVWP